MDLEVICYSKKYVHESELITTFGLIWTFYTEINFFAIVFNL